MNNNEVISLLRLLEDPDESVFQAIKGKFLEDPNQFKEYLENYIALSYSEIGKSRAEFILDEIFFLDFESKLNQYLRNEKSRLIEGVAILETYFSKDIEPNEMVELFDETNKKIWLEINEQLTGIEKVKLIGKILFEKDGVRPLPSGEISAKYLSMFNCMLQKKYSSPSMAMMYCMIAQESEVPLFPLFVPGLFLLSYVDNELADAVFQEKTNGAVFYIHPYDKGEFINHQIIEKYLDENKIKKPLEEIEVMTYNQFLAFYFEMRVLVLKKKKKDSFEVKYAEDVLKLFK